MAHVNWNDPPPGLKEYIDDTIGEALAGFSSAPPNTMRFAGELAIVPYEVGDVVTWHDGLYYCTLPHTPQPLSPALAAHTSQSILNSDNNWQFTMPAGAAVGQAAIAVYCADNINNTTWDPTGWIRLPDADIHSPFGDSLAQVYGKVLSTAEAAASTLVIDGLGAQNPVGLLALFDGASLSDYLGARDVGYTNPVIAPTLSNCGMNLFSTVTPGDTNPPVAPTKSSALEMVTSSSARTLGINQHLMPDGSVGGEVWKDYEANDGNQTGVSTIEVAPGAGFYFAAWARLA